MHYETIELREKPHSIEVSRTTKGDYSWKIKLYFQEPHEGEEVLKRIEEIDEQLKSKFLVMEA